MNNKLIIFAFVAAAVLPSTLSAKEQILCTHAGAHDVIVTLGASRQFGRTLDCIAGDFIADMTPCAPSGGYGMSAGTGSAPLIGIVDRWQDYLSHVGGVTGTFTNDRQIYFSGGFNAPVSNRTINQNRESVGLPPVPGGDRVPQGQGYQELWTFSVNRLTGNAILKRKDTPPFDYTCRKAKAIL
jgi:hypothetical protein